MQGPRLVRFRRTLILLLVAFQAVTVVTILALSSLGNRTAMLEQASHLLANATAESAEHTNAFLDGAQRTVSTTASMFRSGVLDADEPSSLEDYLVNLLEHNIAFAGMYLGTAEGTFLYVSRADDDVLPFRVKKIDSARRGATTWRRDLGLLRSDPHIDPDDNFDPRARPWFAAALATDGFVWTEPYVFFTARKPGITAAAPVRSATGAVIGVIGIDLELEALAGFLAHLDISESGSAFIASAEGVLIAAPFMRDPTRTAGDRLTPRSLVTIDSVTNQAGRRALQTVRDAQAAPASDTSPRFRVGSRDYLTDYLPMTLADGREWVVGAFAPEDEFLQALRERERTNLLIALVILAASMVAGWFLAGTAWTPVAALHDQANRDQLTQVFNRRYVDRHAPTLFSIAADSGDGIAAVIIDIDRFKMVNDSYGHDVGDQVIRETARRLRSAARIGDVVARIGGEEFLLLLPTASADVASSITCRILRWFHDKPVATKAGSLAITFSAGIAVQTADCAGFDAVRAAADTALYDAKHSGRNQVVVAQPMSQRKRPRKSEAKVDTVVSSGGAAATQQAEHAKA